MNQTPHTFSVNSTSDDAVSPELLVVLHPTVSVGFSEPNAGRDKVGSMRIKELTGGCDEILRGFQKTQLFSNGKDTSEIKPIFLGGSS